MEEDSVGRNTESKVSRIVKIGKSDKEKMNENVLEDKMGHYFN